jgi:hypothetical protein
VVDNIPLGLAGVVERHHHDDLEVRAAHFGGVFLDEAVMTGLLGDAESLISSSSRALTTIRWTSPFPCAKPSIAGASKMTTRQVATERGDSDGTRTTGVSLGSGIPHNVRRQMAGRPAPGRRTDRRFWSINEKGDEW